MSAAAEPARAPRALAVRARALPWGVIGVAVALMLVTWHTIAPLAPASGPDPSWIAALHLAAHSDLAWGRDLVFTYGPLGFMDWPVYYFGDTGALALLFLLVTRVTLIALLWVTLRRRVGAAWAVLFLVLTARLIDDATALIAFAVAARYVLAEPDQRRWDGLLVPAAMGAAGGAALLIKINYGVTILALAAVACVAVGGRRHVLRGLAVLAVGALGGLLAGWLVMGQPLSALPDYLHNAARVVSGYSAAMQIEGPGIGWQYSVALILVIAGVVVCFISDEPRARWVALLFCTLLFFIFKEGFVRHDTAAIHAVAFFATVLFAFVFLPWGGLPRSTVVMTLAVLVAATIGATMTQLNHLVTPSKSLSNAWSDISTLWRPGQRRALEAQGRAAVLNAVRLDPRSTALLQHGTVAAWPTETDLVWALGLHWKPVPTIQSYLGYTQGLDALDARALSSSKGPARILWGPQGEFDLRLASVDAPLAAQALLCHYRVEHSQEPYWLILVRRPNRCGPMREIGSVRAGWDENVVVPAPPGPRDVVMARVAGVQVTGLERIRSALYKAYERSVVFDNNPATNSHRFPPGTAGDGMVLRAAPAADYPPPLNVATNPQVISFHRSGSPPGGMPLRVDFYAMRVGR